MLRHIGILAMIYAGVVAQTSLIPEELAGPGRPFLPAILLVVIAASCDATPALLWSGLLGLMLDGLSTERLGIQLTLATFLALAMQLMRPLWGSRSLLALVAMVVLTCLAWRMLSPMTLAVLSGRVVNPEDAFKHAIQDGVWTTLLGSIVILIFRGVFAPGSRVRTAPQPSRNTGWSVGT